MKRRLLCLLLILFAFTPAIHAETETAKDSAVHQLQPETACQLSTEQPNAERMCWYCTEFEYFGGNGLPYGKRCIDGYWSPICLLF